MSNYRKKTATFLLSSTFALFSLSVNAADLVEVQPDPFVGWESMYLGFHGAWGTADVSMQNSSPPGPPSRTNNLDPDRFGGGVQIGYNWQSNEYVAGVIGDFTFLDISDSQAIAPPPRPPYTISADADWLATLRGRLGYLVKPETLVYGHAGFAWADVSGSWISTPGGGAGPWLGSGDETMSGWVVGAGIEHMFTSNMSGFLEYSWIDLGDLKFANVTGPAISFNQDVEMQMVKFGLNFKF